MNSPSIQDSIVEATLFSLSGSTNNALRGKITSVSPGATSRRLFTVQGGNDIHYHYPAIEILSTTNVVVKVDFTLEDFTFTSVNDAMNSFVSVFQEKFSGGDFAGQLKASIAQKDPTTKINLDSIGGASVQFSETKTVRTVEAPTQKPTPTPSPTRAPTTGKIVLFLSLVMYCISLLCTRSSVYC